MVTWRGLRQMLLNGHDLGTQQDLASQERDCESLVEIGDFQINMADRTAILHDQALPLTSDEFDLLVYLAGHPQRLVTEHTILATNSHSGSPNRTNFLRTLWSLRAKLNAVSDGNRYLRTEPWIIYRFQPNPPLRS